MSVGWRACVHPSPDTKEIAVLKLKSQVICETSRPVIQEDRGRYVWICVQICVNSLNFTDL